MKRFLFKEHTAKAEFKKEYGDSKNFMTPYVMEHGGFGTEETSLFYELSHGEGLTGNRIFGVTFIERDEATGNVVRCTDTLSRHFQDLDDAREYIEEVREEHLSPEGNCDDEAE